MALTGVSSVRIDMEVILVRPKTKNDLRKMVGCSVRLAAASNHFYVAQPSHTDNRSPHNHIM